MYPNFFIVGAAKAGTSTLFHMLRQHPDVFFPNEKEPNYFALEQRRPSFSEYGSSYLNSSSVYDQEKYTELYHGAFRKALGDASPSYLYYPMAAERIFAANPKAKIIAVLRDPADRAFSAFLHMKSQGAEDAESFERALLREPCHIENNWWFMAHYRKASLYGEQLQRYYALFGPRQILILDFEALATRPHDAIDSVLKFLELPPYPQTLQPDKYNETFEIRNSLLRSILIEKRFGIRYLRHLLPKSRRTVWASKARRMFAKPKPTLEPRTHDSLNSEFESDIQLTEALTNLTFEHWRSVRDCAEGSV